MGLLKSCVHRRIPLSTGTQVCMGGYVGGGVGVIQCQHCAEPSMVLVY